jgi:signal peptidase
MNMDIKKTANLVFKIVYWLFFVFIGVIALFLILTKFPNLGGFRVMVVLSGSMEPAIHTGSVVVVKREPEYKVGEVITYRFKKDITITHRIKEIKKTKDGKVAAYITKGDANEDEDMQPVLPYRVLGKVLFSVPYTGYAVETVRRPIGFFIVILLPALIVIVDEVRKIIEELKKRKIGKRN